MASNDNTPAAYPAHSPAPWGGFWDRAERFLAEVSNRVAGLSIIGMLVAAIASTTDLLLRWAVSGGVDALNEIVLMAFVVAVTATISAGFAARVGVTVDLLAGVFGRRVSAWLTALGAFSLLVMFGLIGWSLWQHAGILARQNRVTVILGIPQAPFFYAAAGLLGLSLLTQATVTINELRKALALPRSPQPMSRIGVAGLALLGVVAVLGAVLVYDFPGASRWAQTNVGWMALVSFGVLWLMLLAMIPVAVVMGVVGTVGTALFIGTAPALSTLGGEVSGFLTNYGVAALPLFLMMGSFAAAAGISDDIYRISQALLGGLRGGLAMATIGSCAGFGAVTGSSLSNVAMFGRIALPQMKERKYAPEFAAGCIAAGGTLGALIPPSTILVVYSLLSEASLGRLFMAAILPGILAVMLYLATIWITVRLRPHYAPPATKAPKGELRRALLNSGAFIALFGSVIGGLYSGVFTANEAAAVGAVGAFVIALLRGRLNRANIWRVMSETTRTTAMIYSLIFGVLMFSFFMAITNVPLAIVDMIGALNLSSMATIVLLLLLLLLLGCVMDSMSIMMITVPIILPLIQQLGYDVIWWGIVALVVVENGLITPPFGLHLFMLRSMDRSITLRQLYVGVLPFVAADMVRLLLLLLIPALVLWLPSTMIN